MALKLNRTRQRWGERNKTVLKKLWPQTSPDIDLQAGFTSSWWPQKVQVMDYFKVVPDWYFPKTPCGSKGKSSLEESTSTLGLKETPQTIFENNKYVVQKMEHTRKKGIMSKNQQKPTCKEFSSRNDHKQI